jgi:hypothetical protein
LTVYRRPVRLLGDVYALDLTGEERDVVKRLLQELGELVEEDDATVQRLFPPAHRDDPEASAAFAALARDGLVQGRRTAIDAVLASVDRDRLSHAEVEAWCGALNDLRLVLGERLGVTEDLYVDGIDRRDPRAPQLALYGWLTWLQGEIVEVLATRL